MHIYIYFYICIYIYIYIFSTLRESPPPSCFWQFGLAFHVRIMCKILHDRLARFWMHSGAKMGQVGALGGLLGALGGLLGALEGSWEAPEGLLAPRANLECILEGSWSQLGSKMAPTWGAGWVQDGLQIDEKLIPNAITFFIDFWIEILSILEPSWSAS